MAQRVLLSHHHGDREIAAILAKTISRVTLGQITAWYSSDQSGGGGMRAGDLWMPTLIERLRESHGAIALLTPRSRQQPWLYFECGFIAAREASDVIPVCVGIDSLNDVPFPLAMFQSYQISDPESLVRFLQKLAGRFGVGFDEEMARPVAQSAITSLVEANAMQMRAAEPQVELPFVDQIKEHIDRRFVEISRLAEQQRTSSEPVVRQHTVPIKLQFPGLASSDFLVIRDSDVVQDVLDAVYLKLESHVKPYSYLHAWILREATTDTFLAAPGGRSMDDRAITRDDRRWLFDDVPARYVFRTGTRWEAYPLREEYFRRPPEVCFPEDE